ncbi:unnamed protein product [Gemmata massiliana]|uniref:Uncharacterized protein n=1 Tax=Gemmata massiliana TaxID=1210884 RepID=A0A6P2D310_9BACT|nr:hypothetical protein [Gemmata massiliana]VTR95257.1 unnamed protein product [Gemmata massiliana]
MTTTRKIVVSPYQVEVPRQKATKPGFKPGKKKPSAPARIRYRWRAELFEGGQMVRAVEGFELPDEALGALVRDMAHQCASPDDVVDLVAGLFGNLDVRGANVTLGRALRMSVRNPNRRNAGCVVEIGDPGLEVEPAAKGGAL